MQKHIHPGYELIFVLDGELINDTGHHGAGTLEVCPPDSGHALASEKGCTFLVVWEQPVRLATPAAEIAQLARASSGCGAFCACN